MKNQKLPVTDSIEELARFWDTHDVTDYLDQLEEVTEPIFAGDATSFSLPPELVARAAFLARVHRAGGIEAWLSRIIRERIELEEVAFAAAKRELASSARK